MYHQRSVSQLCHSRLLHYCFLWFVFLPPLSLYLPCLRCTNLIIGTREVIVEPDVFKYSHCAPIHGERAYEFIGSYNGPAWRPGPGIAPVTSFQLGMHSPSFLLSHFSLAFSYLLHVFFMSCLTSTYRNKRCPEWNSQ